MSLTKMEQQTDKGDASSSIINLQDTYQDLSNAEDPQKVQQLTAVLLSFLNQTQGYEFQGCLQLVLKVIEKGYTNLLSESSNFLSKIMTHFVQLSTAMKTLPSPQLQYRQLFTLSILAQIVRQQPKCEIPFTKDFLMELFEMEAERIDYGARAKLLTLLGVLFGNLCRQSALLRELKMASMLKEAILQNYSLIEQTFTVKLFNQCIVQLQTRKLTKFSITEIERYGIKDALIKTVGKGKQEAIEQYLQKLFGKKQS